MKSKIKMKKNISIVYFLFLLQIKNLRGRSEEFEKCINLEKTVISSSNCTDIKIPDSEGYKCCSMKITYNTDSSYSCLALENKYTTSREVLNEYMSQRDISFFFITVGGKMEIECGGSLQISENYKKLSDEYLNCYTNHIKGIENENDCTKNDIPEGEGSKCCFVETSSISNNGNIINDKRCYMIQDNYFTNDKNLSNYLLDESNINNLEEINNTNVTISCKNYDKFFFSGIKKNANKPYPSDENNESDENSKFKPSLPKKESSSKTWVIILIILGIIFLIGIIIILIVVFYCRKRKEHLEPNKTTEITEHNLNNNTTISNSNT